MYVFFFFLSLLVFSFLERAFLGIGSLRGCFVEGCLASLVFGEGRMDGWVYLLCRWMILVLVEFQASVVVHMHLSRCLERRTDKMVLMGRR